MFLVHAMLSNIHLVQGFPFEVSSLHISAGIIPTEPLPEPGTIAPNCTDPFVMTISGGIATIIGILEGLGIAIGVIGVVMGGLMRATSFGNERRIAMSNTAITCAVIGVVIVLIATTFGNSVPTWFGITNGCKLGPPLTPTTTAFIWQQDPAGGEERMKLGFTISKGSLSER